MEPPKTKEAVDGLMFLFVNFALLISVLLFIPANLFLAKMFSKDKSERKTTCA